MDDTAGEREGTVVWVSAVVSAGAAAAAVAREDTDTLERVALIAEDAGPCCTARNGGVALWAVGVGAVGILPAASAAATLPSRLLFCCPLPTMPPLLPMLLLLLLPAVAVARPPLS